MNKDNLLKAINGIYRKDEWLNELFGCIGAEMDGMDGDIENVKNNVFVDTATEQGIAYYEKITNTVPRAGQTLDERRSAVLAKLRSDGMVTLDMLQNVANAWKNGEIEVSFTDGKIKLSFVGEYGVPANLTALKAALEEIKPAHLVIDYGFRYLLIREIHGVMTLTQIETEKLSKFAGGI